LLAMATRYGSSVASPAQMPIPTSHSLRHWPPGLDGIEKKIEPPGHFTGNASYPPELQICQTTAL